MPELAKAYEPQQVEDRLYAQWQESGVFVADPASPKPPYSIVMPPPNVTGKLTLGHVLNNTIQDILARRARMQGKEVLWLPGTDHAGLATQTAVEKHLRQNEKKTRHDFGRDAFVERVWQWKEEFGGIITQQLRKLGASCDWSRERFTMDADYARAVQEVFVRLYNEGLIYRGTRMVNWCPGSLTAISDEEVIPTKQKGFLYHVKYELIDDQPGEEKTGILDTLAEIAGAFGGLAPESTEEGSPAVVAGVGSTPVGADAPISDSDFGASAPTRPRAEVGLPLISTLRGSGVGPTPATTESPAVATIPAFLTVATTRPETIMADVALAVKPDGRWAHLIGRQVWRPLHRAPIPIIGDDAVEEGFGTGVLKVTPAHDKTDYEIGKRHNLPVIDILTPNGKINDPGDHDAAELHGLDRFDARKRSAEILQERGLLVKEEPYENTVGFSERANVPIEPRLSEQWFLKYPNIDEALALLRDGHVNFHPAHWTKVYEHWLENIQDWCISRQVWWGHRIPVWYKAPSSAASSVILSLSKDQPPNDAHGEEPSSSHELSGSPTSARGRVGANAPKSASEIGASAPTGVGPTPATTELGTSVPTRPRAEVGLPAGAESPRSTSATETRCQLSSPGEGWTQDPDTLDTWFSSWLWAYETMRREDGTRAKFYPTSALVTGPDIIFLWVARMLIAGLHFQPNGAKSTPTETLEANLAFKDVYFTGLIRDKQGRKLSKSLGNSPDPLDLIAKYGADGLRFGLIRIAPQGADIRFDEKQIEEGRNFCNKLWNVCRFRTLYGQIDPDADPSTSALTPFAVELLDLLHTLIGDVNHAIDAFNFSEAASRIYSFVWDDLAARFVEVAKNDFGQPESPTHAGTLATFDYVISRVLRLFHPFAPFVTEELWCELGFGASAPTGVEPTPATAETAHGATGRAFSEDSLPTVARRSTATSIQLEPWPTETAQSSNNPSSQKISGISARQVYETADLGRSLRGELGLPSNQKIPFYLERPEGELPPDLKLALQTLLNASELFSGAPDVPGPKCFTPLGQLYLPGTGLIDPALETERLKKDLAKVTKDLEQTRRKLGDANMLAKAPPAKVEEWRKLEVDLVAREKSIRASLGDHS